jgi:hypothetical protein
MSHCGSWNSAGLAIVIEEKVFAEYGLFALQSQYTGEVAFALGVPEAGRLLLAGRGGACSTAVDPTTTPRCVLNCGATAFCYRQ